MIFFLEALQAPHAGTNMVVLSSSPPWSILNKFNAARNFSSGQQAVHEVYQESLQDVASNSCNFSTLGRWARRSQIQNQPGQLNEMLS